MCNHCKHTLTDSSNRCRFSFRPCIFLMDRPQDSPNGVPTLVLRVTLTVPAHSVVENRFIL